MMMSRVDLNPAHLAPLKLAVHGESVHLQRKPARWQIEAQR